MSALELLEKLGNPLRYYDGRNMQIVQMSLCIKKEDAKILFYDYDGNETDTCMFPHKWRFVWATAPIDPDMFSMAVRDVYDVDDVPYYYVTITLTPNIILDSYREQIDPPEVIDWENQLLPWKKYDHYTYTSK